MLFVSEVGSMVGKGWQPQAQFEYKKLTYCSNWWLPRFYTWAQNVQLQPSKIL